MSRPNPTQIECEVCGDAPVPNPVTLRRLCAKHLAVEALEKFGRHTTTDCDASANKCACGLLDVVAVLKGRA